MTTCSALKNYAEKIPNDMLKQLLFGDGINSDSCKDILNNPDHYKSALSLLPIILKPILTKYLSETISDNLINQYQPSINELSELLSSCSQNFCNNGPDIELCDSINKLLSQILSDSDLIEHKNIILQIICSIKQPELQTILINTFGNDFYNNLKLLQPILDNCICKNIPQQDTIKQVCNLLNPCEQSSKQECINLPDRTYTNKKYLNITIIILCISIIFFFLSFNIPNKPLKVIIILLLSLFIISSLLILTLNPYNILYLDTEKTNKWINIPGTYKGQTKIDLINTTISMTFKLNDNNQIKVIDYQIIPNDSKYYKNIDKILSPCLNTDLSIITNNPGQFGYKIIGQCLQKNPDGTGIAELAVTQTGSKDNLKNNIILIIVINVLGNLHTIQLKVSLNKE
jgi:hypothetical protein